ncbi:polysulfide reductase NrfD [candidate division KSB1 bacterium]|nr:polysulfide reductase NrfD [candidate division KSB1 bacterium]
MNQTNYFNELERDVLSAMKKPNMSYWAALGFSASLLLMWALCWGYQIKEGLYVTGINNPVGWGIYLTNFVFWVGIAHSGTLISAVLYLFRAKFRNSFNRTAEAMTIIAIMVAGLFPIIHLGRMWKFYWLLPYPNQRLLWVNFRSPLVWDVFAVSTYFIVSLVFFYVGLVPDLAIVKRHVKGIRQRVYSILSLGWTGSLRQWVHYNKLYMFLAAFATPLVISVHSVVSWDFAMSITPGWHTTIFAPYFVAGAIFSGTAMVLTLVIPMRKILSLEKYITVDKFEGIAKVLLFTSLIVTYAYIVEFGIASYSDNIYELSIFKYRMVGDYRVIYWIMICCNSLIPMTLFVKKLRRNLVYLFILSIFVNIGMWSERFNIIISSLSHEYMPYAWGLYRPSFIEIGIFVGSFGMFFTFFLIFLKLLPVLAMSEIKEEAE